MKKFMHNAIILPKVANRFEVDVNKLIPIVLSYIKTGNAELYNIKMHYTFGPTSCFIKQELSAFMHESMEYYLSFPHVVSVELTPYRLIIRYKDNHEQAY